MAAPAPEGRDGRAQGAEAGRADDLTQVDLRVVVVRRLATAREGDATVATGEHGLGRRGERQTGEEGEPSGANAARQSARGVDMHGVSFAPAQGGRLADDMCTLA